MRGLNGDDDDGIWINPVSSITHKHTQTYTSLAFIDRSLLYNNNNVGKIANKKSYKI